MHLPCTNTYGVLDESELTQDRFRIKEKTETSYTQTIDPMRIPKQSFFNAIGRPVWQCINQSGGADPAAR